MANPGTDFQSTIARGTRQICPVLFLLLAVTLVSIENLLADGPYPAISGISASADDAAVAGQNPAAMTLFDDRVNRFELMGFFSDNTWEAILGDTGQTRLSEDSSTTVVPAGAMVIPFRDNWWFGFTFVGMAFSEEYDEGWPGRYIIEEYSLISVSAFPSIATKLTDRLSVGASMALTYTTYDQSKAVLNLDPGFDDGKLDIDTDGLSVGFGLSALYEFSDRTRAGLTWLSEIEPSLDGYADFSGLGPITEAILDQADLLGTPVDVESRQPQAMTVGMYHDFKNDHTMTLDLAWVDFSEFQLSEIYLNDNQLTSSMVDYDDIWALSGSYSWPVAEGWRLGVGGFIVDDMVSDENRTLTLRLDDIWSLGFGFQWQWKKDRTISASLNYMQLGDAPVTIDDVPGAGTISGRYIDRQTIYLRASISLGAGRS